MEKSELTIGMARLTDCAILAAAKERGCFARQGLKVRLVRRSSWAAMRDDLAMGVLDAAHMLSPQVVASAAGLGPFPSTFTTAFAFNLNGNAITVSTGLYDEMRDAAPDTVNRLPFSAAPLKRVIERREKRGHPPLVLAHVYPFSMHAYELRYWLGASNINPGRDLHLAVVPPAQMVDSLRAGEIDGFCVGEPWNNAAILAGLGRTLINSCEIWSNSPEKVLAVRNDWADRHPETHRALLRALLEAAAWVDQPGNRIAAAQMISGPEYVDMPLDSLVSSLSGKNRQTGGELRVDMPDFNVFHRYGANFPWISHAKWILTQMIRWGELHRDVDIEAISRAAFRPDIYRPAAAEMNIACPNIDEKVEGLHDHSWVLKDATSPIAFGPDRFMDGRVFDPDDIETYLAGFSVRAEAVLSTPTEVVH